MRDYIDEIITKIEAEMGVPQNFLIVNGLQKALDIVRVHEKPESWRKVEDLMSEELSKMQTKIDSGNYTFDEVMAHCKKVKELQSLLGGEGFDA